MSARNRVTTALIAISVPMNELHHIWADNYSKVNPWIALNYPQDIQWYMKFLFIKITELTLAVIIYRLARMQPNMRMVGLGLLVFHCIDTFMFFYNWNKRGSYALVYSMTPLVVWLVYEVNGVIQNTKAWYSRRRKKHLESGSEFINHNQNQLA